ncbi:uncharacterized protein LOC134841364 isoform X2 [Symsagittifera roscoffensis]|uniref:uncharacterized protein LOC134841364 isoform X1 n=1 Tax=Symsagittifera roscoffensis TaxID=84072 RepID=UPI00307BEAF5
MFLANQQFRSLICSNVPLEYNNDNDLYNHFAKYGNVQAVVPAPTKGRAKVVFEMAHEAMHAKQSGAKIDMSLPPMRLFFADDNRVSRVAYNEHEKGRDDSDIERIRDSRDQVRVNRSRRVNSTESLSEHEPLTIRTHLNQARRAISLHQPRNTTAFQTTLSEAESFASSRFKKINSPKSPLGGEITKTKSSLVDSNRKAGDKLLRRARSNQLKSTSVFVKVNRSNMVDNALPDNEPRQTVFGKVEPLGASSVFGKLKETSGATFAFGLGGLSAPGSKIFENFAVNTNESITSIAPPRLKRSLHDDNEGEKSIKSELAPSKKFAGSQKVKMDTEVVTNVGQLSLAAKIEKLKTRDEGLRKTTLSGAKGNILVGTLDQMCPELEMYVRQSTNRVDEYELGADGEPDYSKFIKEYTRSSADKEIPLPHEVRSINGLIISMDYLMDTVMNLYDSKERLRSFNRGNWFNFLWNRTRSIRNDITVQNLHTVKSAELIEKITRFHIVCGYVLCDADYHEFDPKVNNEHFSKSMQTLKHMYYDLSRKNIACKNEAEFRAYELLKHLDSPGTALVEAAKYAPSVLNDPTFQLSLKIHRAYTQGNFVRFLRLYKKEATFLMSCILHPCLTETRNAILRCLSMSCGTSKNIYSGIQIQQLLSFSATEQTLAFCQQFGFSLVEKTLVEVRKLSSDEELPSGDILNNKEPEMVEVKQKLSFGEIVNGSEPIGSSYKQLLAGKFISRSVVSVEVDEAPVDEPDNHAVDFLENDLNASETSIDEDSLNSLAGDFYEEILTEVLQDQIKDAHREIVTKAIVLRDLMMQLHAKIETELVQEMSIEILTEVTYESRKSIVDSSTIVYAELLDDVVSSECEIVCRTEVDNQKRENLISDIANDVFSEVEIGVVKDLVRDVADEIVKSEYERASDILLLRKYYKLWKLQMGKSKQDRIYRESFPPKIGSWQVAEKIPVVNASEKLNCFSNLSEAQRCLNEVTAIEISTPFSTDQLLTECISKFVHLAIINVSPACEFSEWFIEKLSGKRTYNEKSMLLEAENKVIRFEKSSMLSNICISWTTVGNSQKALEEYNPNFVLILDPMGVIEESWVQNTSENNEEVFTTLYVTTSDYNFSNAENDHLNKFVFDCSDLPSFYSSSRHFLTLTQRCIKDCTSIYPIPRPISLRGFISSSVKEWFSLFLSHSYLKGLNEAFKEQMTIEWLMELYDSLVNQMESFITSNQIVFPLSIFKTAISEASEDEVKSLFKSLKIFPMNLLPLVNSCNTWIECLDILDKLIQSIYAFEDAQNFASKLEKLLMVEFSQSAEKIVESAQNFPWVSVLCELIAHNLDFSFNGLGERNLFLTCPESDFVFDRPKCWHLFMNSVLSFKKVLSYTVNGTVVLIK